MEAADHRDESLGRQRAGPDAAALARGAGRCTGGNPQALGGAALGTAPDQAAGGRGDDAEDRAASVDEREIDRELVESGQQFAGTIEGIDQKKTAAEPRRRDAAGR